MTDYSKPMRIQARKGSQAELLYYKQSKLPGAAIAPGIFPDLAEDLIYHGGKIVPQMQFQNVYLGGSGAWVESDRANIDDAILRAMRLKSLNNVVAQYFSNQSALACDARASFVDSAPVTTELDEDALQRKITELFGSFALAREALDTTIFNLILPSRAVLRLDESTSRNGLGGFHSSVRVKTPDGAEVLIYYSANVFSEILADGENGIVAFDRPWKNVVGTLYHELNEFRTDPDVADAIRQNSNDLLGWSSRNGREIGDQPIFAASSLDLVFREVDPEDGGSKLPVQFLYSNTVHGAEGPITGAQQRLLKSPSPASGHPGSPKANRPRPHGVRMRGADLGRGSLLFGGPFGRMFRALPPADFGADDAASFAALHLLAAKMIADPDAPKDGPDDEESGLPAAYTYLGQFIDHDLTFDPASSLQKQNDPDALVDFRTPRFDLDNVYGRGPDDEPYLYDDDGRSFNLGQPLSGAQANARAHDLPRSQPRAGSARRAIIGDPRNDENVIVSQLQGLFHRFHNQIASQHPDWDFTRIQREVRFHYQWLVLNDFLPSIVSSNVLDQVVPHVGKKTNAHLDKPRLEFYHARDDAFMPLEFSAAAYRFGHSMVRPAYRLSENVGPLAIFETNPLRALTGFREFPGNWAIDWNLFMDLEPRDANGATRTQLAYRIDTSLVNPLGNLPPTIAKNPAVLAERNLLRGLRMRLPSGQAIARAMGIQPLADDQILLGKFTGNPADIIGPVVNVSPAFADNCPLWTYVLAEAVETDAIVRTKQGPRTVKTRKLGPVGGRIISETFVGLLLKDSSSFIAQDPLWTPSLAENGVFGLRELIRVALAG